MFNLIFRKGAYGDELSWYRIPSLLRQLNEDEIKKVGQLPKELVILSKYSTIGIGTVQKLFDQIKEKQLNSRVPEPVTSKL